MQTIRYYFTGLIVCILCVFLLSSEANAQEAPSESEPKAWTLGVHAISLHKRGSGLQTVTPGVYAIHSSGLTLGAFRNSYARPSVYVAYSLTSGPWGLTMGAVTGYPRARVLPMFAPSYKFDNGLRVSVIPSPFGNSAIHFSKEFN